MRRPARPASPDRRLHAAHRRIQDWSAQQAIAYNNRANAYIRLGQRGKGIADYGAAIRLNPKYANAYLNLGRTYRELGNTQLYLLHCDKAIKLNSKCAECWDTRAHINEALGRRQAAITEFRKALRLDASLKSSRAGLKRLAARP